MPAGTSAALELCPPVPGTLRRLRIDANSVIVGRTQRGNEAAERPAPDLGHRRRRGRELGADEWPDRGKRTGTRRREQRFAVPAGASDPVSDALWLGRCCNLGLSFDLAERDQDAAADLAASGH
jgi:hypothetical protein